MVEKLTPNGRYPAILGNLEGLLYDTIRFICNYGVTRYYYASLHRLYNHSNKPIFFLHDVVLLLFAAHCFFILV